MFSLTMKETIEVLLTIKEAAGILGLSERQVYRLKARVKRAGAKGVVHKTKGKKRPRRLTGKVKDKINRLYTTKYKGFNITHMTEFLNTEEGIKVLRESVRQILLFAVPVNNYSALQTTLENRTLFQMGQAALENQSLLKKGARRQESEDRKNPDP